MVKGLFVAVPEIAVEFDDTLCNPGLNGTGATNLARVTAPFGRPMGIWNAMNLRQLRISRRSIAIAAALVGTASLAIGAHAALNKRTLDAARAAAAEQTAEAMRRPARWRW